MKGHLSEEEGLYFGYCNLYLNGICGLKCLVLNIHSTYFVPKLIVLRVINRILQFFFFLLNLELKSLKDWGERENAFCSCVIYNGGLFHLYHHYVKKEKNVRSSKNRSS